MLYGVETQASGAVVTPAAYGAKAVTFNPCKLILSSCTCTDNAFFGFAGWFKSAWASNAVAFVVDPLNHYNSYLAAFGAGATPAEFNIQNSTGDDLLFDFGNVGGSTTWHHIIGAAMTNASAGAKIVKVYVDDVLQTGTPTFGTPAFNISTNGLPVYVGSDGSNNWTGSMADLSIWAGKDLLQGGSAISSTVRRLFTDGANKPLNPSVAIAALGAPPIFLSGDASAFRLNSLGTSGAFTLSTGSLSNDPSGP